MAAGFAPLLIVDDHAVMAQALAMALRLQGFEPVTVVGGEPIDPAAVYAAAGELGGSGVVVLDLHLGDGVVATPMIDPLRRQGVKVLVLTAERDPARLAECLEAGADGVFDKAQPFDQLVELLHDAARGFSIMSISAREELLSSTRRTRADEHHRLERFTALTARERDVLAGLLSGSSAEEIAIANGVAISTVRTHIKGLLRKLGVNSQLSAVALARDAGWSYGSR